MDNDSMQIKPRIQSFILLGIMIYVFIIRILNGSDFLRVLEVLISVLILGFVLYILCEQKRHLFAHLVLFVLIFSNALGDWVRMFLSFNFSTFSWTTPFSLELLINFLIALYLMYIIIMSYKNQPITLSFQQHKVIIPILLLAGYLYLRFGFGTTLLFILPVGLLYTGKAYLATTMLIIYVLSNVPFEVIQTIASGAISFTNIHYWVMVLLAIFTLSISIRLALDLRDM